MKYIAERRVPNPVVLTGDIHSNWVNELRIDDRKPDEAVIATEFVGTSISSGGNGEDKPRRTGKTARRQSLRQVPQPGAGLRPLPSHAGDLDQRLRGGG